MSKEAPRTCGNPVLPGWYADPEIHIFGGRYWIFPTTSRPYEDQASFEAWSSADLTDWRNEGVILDLADVPWSTNRAAWAPSCAERDGRYYLYFSAGDGAGLGVAVADAPGGPYHDALGEPLVREYHHGAQPIDAHAFLDDDGRAYLYWGGWRKAVMAPLGDDMISLAGDIRDITPAHYVEGPFMLKRRGIYYFMWSEGNWTDSTYQVAYAVAQSPYGPFERVGAVLINNPAVANAAGHHSVVQLPGTDTYIIAYHRRPLGLTNPHHRVVCLDEMCFREDGTIETILLSDCGVKPHPLSEITVNR